MTGTSWVGFRLRPRLRQGNGDLAVVGQHSGYSIATDAACAPEVNLLQKGTRPAPTMMNWRLFDISGLILPIAMGWRFRSMDGTAGPRRRPVVQCGDKGCSRTRFRAAAESMELRQDGQLIAYRVASFMDIGND